MKIRMKTHRMVAFLFLLCLVACGNAKAERVAPAASSTSALRVLDASYRFTASWASGSLELPDDETFVRLRTTGRGDLSMLTTEVPFETSVDFRGRFLEVQIRADEVSRLAAVELRLMSGTEDYFAFGTPLFGDAEFNPLQNGSWLNLTLSFGEATFHGSPQRGAIDRIVVLVRDRGVGPGGEPRPVALDLGRVRAIPHPRHGVLSLTFDDGYAEHLHVAARLMKEHGFSGTAYVMPDQVGLEGYMSLDELRVLADTYGWELGAHHFTPFTEMDDALLAETVRGVQRYFERNHLRGGGQHLAYPLGKIDSKRVLPMARRFFTTARLAAAGPETLPPGDPHRLRAYNVLSTTTPEEIGGAAKRAREHGEWLILMFHFLVEEPEIDTAYGIEHFEEMLQAIAESGVEVRTVGEVWQERALPAAVVLD
jgi:peptidoglycan/xylan/chitin deacetylase (PgdA/CDA1 family)